ncbi:MAG: hypothetical protein B7C24_02660 [Bacteroidetes bacterium 4572_77]|nr:MAG: hypothetical protein B7C24_02660 [Bacteroidetes bacterium 4572_77]
MKNGFSFCLVVTKLFRKDITLLIWHSPSDKEWKTLEMYLGMSQSETDNTSWRGTDEGGKMKETGTTHWNSPNTGATNTSGFNALPGDGGPLHSLGYYGYWWSSTEDSGSSARSRRLGYDSNRVGRSNSSKTFGFSIRCLKD